jgi:hypothetical protein
VVGSDRRPTGDVIAKDGQWFGVWSKQVGPGGTSAQTELFSAGSVLPVRRVTTSAANDDQQPTLAYSASIPVMIWSRSAAPASSEFSDLYKAKFIGGTWEAPQPFATLGSANFDPDMQIAGGRTFVAWNRGVGVWVASNPFGPFTSHHFNTTGFRPKVAASTTGGVVDHIFVLFTTFGPRLEVNQPFFAESASDGSVDLAWDGTRIAPAIAYGLGVGGHATKGTATYWDRTANAVAIRSQA